MATVTFIQGNTVSRTVTLYETDGTTLLGDISGGTVKFRIVTDLDDAKAAAVYNNEALTISDGAASEATLSIARSVSKDWTPGEYYYEIEYIDSSSNYSHTYWDICIIKQSIYAED